MILTCVLSVDVNGEIGIQTTVSHCDEGGWRLGDRVDGVDDARLDQARALGAQTVNTRAPDDGRAGVF